MNFSEISARVNQIGSETHTGGAADVQPKQRRGRSNKKLRNWLLGLAFSLVPAFSDALIVLFLERPLYEVAITFLAHTSIIFVGVSLIVSAMNDLEANQQGRSTVYIVLLIAGVCFYTAESAVTLFGHPVGVGTVIAVNMLCLVGPLVLGLVQYFEKRNAFDLHPCHQ